MLSALKQVPFLGGLQGRETVTNLVYKISACGSRVTDVKLLVRKRKTHGNSEQNVLKPKNVAGVVNRLSSFFSASHRKEKLAVRPSAFRYVVKLPHAFINLPSSKPALT